MPSFAVVDTRTGEIVRAGDVPETDLPLQIYVVEHDVGADGQPVPRQQTYSYLELRPGRHDPQAEYWIEAEGAFGPRPKLIDVAVLQLAVGEERTYAVPNGTRVSMIAPATGVQLLGEIVDDEALTIVSPKPARFTVRIEPPWPYRHQMVEVSVQ